MSLLYQKIPQLLCGFDHTLLMRLDIDSDDSLDGPDP
jgi:hypothetical protein